jgi:hypothetical protein
VKTVDGYIVVGVMRGTTQMGGWTKPKLFWTVLSHCQRLCDMSRHVQSESLESGLGAGYVWPDRSF